jgi:hypothetical protein
LLEVKSNTSQVGFSLIPASGNNLAGSKSQGSMFTEWLGQVVADEDTPGLLRTN